MIIFVHAGPFYIMSFQGTLIDATAKKEGVLWEDVVTVRCCPKRREPWTR